MSEVLKAGNVVKFYVMCNKLKSVIRTGWIRWNIKAERVESVAEHVYGTQMLAIAMASEYGYHLDLKKVIMMIAVHELEEVLIGDFTPYDITSEEKAKIGQAAVREILSPLLLKEEIESLIAEFEQRQTKEALFAYYCDKLECDLQCKLYDEQELVDFELDKNEEICGIEMHEYEKLSYKTLPKTWSEMWIKIDRELYKKDDNFLEIIDFILKNQISC